MSLWALPCGFPIPALAQSQQPPTVEGGETGAAGAWATGTIAAKPQPDRQLSGSISGTVIVQTGAVAVGAQVELTRAGQSGKQEVLSGNDGQFSFGNLAPGPFHLAITSKGFTTQVCSGVLHPAEAYIVPEIKLVVAPAVTEVKVELTQVQVAEVQVKEQEKQRVLGFIPNFYASYVPNAAPLSPKQKFQLAWKSTTDPVTIVATGALAGIEQAADQYGGYGQGAEGYAKRFGAAYTSVFTGTFIGSAILPSLLKQDPRYFYRGTGSTGSRLLYALGNAVICKGDDKRWQPNYSGIIGSFASSSISYLYHPASDRSGGELVQNALIRMGESAIAGVFQEFVLRKLTPHLKSHPQSQPTPQP